jgi:hypothetical protein
MYRVSSSLSPLDEDYQTEGNKEEKILSLIVSFLKLACAVLVFCVLARDARQICGHQCAGCYFLVFGERDFEEYSLTNEGRIYLILAVALVANGDL